MVTGDNVLTARAIASECNILTPNGVVIEGKDFRVMPEEQMLEIIPRIDVSIRYSSVLTTLMLHCTQELSWAIQGKARNTTINAHTVRI